MFSFHIFAADLTNPLKNARFYEKSIISIASAAVALRLQQRRAGAGSRP